ncbi:hypothetical protein [Nonomuraea sp. NEAU-A123]|uniref:hypothetical protein n=1 Tax=Nonomuraea sp. NEAU-A123 TaxID=2839649 RepID=UPI001BE3F79A|nr:hypothetical protein [Nonomuraea sp. NEAU-A123]MBT2228638.1 hypothetical protein [Nonomuraea sp. NEAU-A123]
MAEKVATTPASPPVRGVPLVVLMPTAWSGGIGTDLPGQTFCADVRERGKPRPQAVACRFVVPEGTVVRLTAKARDRHPDLVHEFDTLRLDLCRNGEWSANTRTATCTVSVKTGTVLCLGSNDPTEAMVRIVCPWAEQGAAVLPAIAPPGFTFGSHTGPTYDALLS